MKPVSEKLFRQNSAGASLRNRKVLIWILCLAALSVGARNFEPGFAPDSPIYSTISRNIVASGDWIRLNADIPDYQPYFADHPHLGFWLVALVFKVLPAADWSARVMGHLLYVGFLLMFFFMIRSYHDERTATWTVLLLWSWYIFSNTFSSFLMGPGVVFFGTAALFLWDRSLRRSDVAGAFVSGILLTFALLYKGMAVMGFFPAFLVALVWKNGSEPRPLWGRLSVAWLLGFLGTLGLYALLVLKGAPEFVSIYFQRQFELRIRQVMNPLNVFDSVYLTTWLRYTYGLILLVGLAWIKRPWSRGVVLATTMFLSYFIINPTAGLIGPPNHYIFAMPWVAWLVSYGVLRLIPIAPRSLVRFTSGFAIFAVIVLQYFPVRVHGGGPAAAQTAIAEVSRQTPVSVLILDHPPLSSSHHMGGVFAWYGTLPVSYVKEGEVVAARKDALYFLHAFRSDKSETLRSVGWCTLGSYASGTLWSECSTAPRIKLTAR